MSSSFELIFEKPRDQNIEMEAETEMEIDEPINIDDINGIVLLSDEDLSKVLAHLVRYLSPKSLLECRQVCKAWCSSLRNEKKIIGRYKLVVRPEPAVEPGAEDNVKDKIWREGVNMSLILHPEIVAIENNAFLHPTTELFNPICRSIGEVVSELKITRCDFQPDEFRSIFVNFPLLKKFTLESSKLLGKIPEPGQNGGSGDTDEQMEIMIKSPLKILILVNLQRVDSTYFKYLASIIQELEDLKIHNCLQEYKIAEQLRKLNLEDPETLKNPLDPIENIHGGILRLIRVNSKSLRKLWLYRNYKQSVWLTSMAKTMKELKLTEFFISETLPEKEIVTLNPQVYEWKEPTEILTFVNSQPSIDSLYVQTFNLFEPHFFAKLLQPQLMQNLHRFTMTVDLLADATKPSFDLSPYLKNMPNLEYFCLIDQVRENNSLPIENRYLGRASRLPTTHMNPTLNPTFLKNFPPQLRELVVKKYWLNTHWILQAFNDHLTGLNNAPDLNPSPNPFPSLTRLEISSSVGSNLSHVWNWDIGLQIIIHELPLLESLTLVGSTITDVGICGLPKNHCKLVSDSDLFNLPDYIPVNKFEFKCSLFKYTVKANFLSALQHLKELNLENSLRIENTSLILGFRFEKLEHLNLNNCSKITNYGIRGLVKNCSKTLKSLKIIGNTSITPLGYNELITKCPKIQKIEVSRVEPTALLQGRHFKLSENFWDIVVNKPYLPVDRDLKVPDRPRNRFRDLRHMNIRDWNMHGNRRKRERREGEITFFEIEPPKTT